MLLFLFLILDHLFFTFLSLHSFQNSFYHHFILFASFCLFLLFKYFLFLNLVVLVFNIVYSFIVLTLIFTHYSCLVLYIFLLIILLLSHSQYWLQIMFHNKNIFLPFFFLEIKCSLLILFLFNLFTIKNFMKSYQIKYCQ